MSERDSALRAHEALPHAPPGGKPPETPGPLSLEHRLYARGRIGQGFAKPAQNAALDRSVPLRDNPLRRGKGGLRQNSALRAHEALPHTPPGGRPPETPKNSGVRLDRDRPSHGSRDRQGVGTCGSELTSSA